MNYVISKWPKIRLGDCLGGMFHLNEPPRIIGQRRRRERPEIMISQNGASSHIGEVAVHRMQIGFSCRWDVDLFDITIIRNDNDGISVTAYNRDTEDEEVRIIEEIMWFNLQTIIDDLYNGVPLVDCRVQ